MSRRITPRLELMLKVGLRGEDFWDLCCDHGYLGEAAWHSRWFKQIHFVDQVPHIIEKLRIRMNSPAGAEYLCSRAEDLPVMRGSVVLAGVGGYSVIKILTAWKQSGSLRAGRLILNPLSHVGELREFLKSYEIYREVKTLEVVERKRVREVIVLEPSSVSN